MAAAAEHATDGQTVNNDIHADRDYRTHMAVVYTRRAIDAALGRSDLRTRRIRACASIRSPLADAPRRAWMVPSSRVT